jgi:hypothetical protein
MTRVWTYTIVCSFLALCTYSELFPVAEDSSTLSLLCLSVLALNIVAVTPLMDGQVEHLNLRIRLCLYTPVMVTSLALLYRADHIRVEERFTIRGVNILRLLYPTRRNRATSGSAQRSEPEVPEL